MSCASYLEEGEEEHDQEAEEEGAAAAALAGDDRHGLFVEDSRVCLLCGDRREPVDLI